MCEYLDDKQIEQMRPSQNLINEEFILPLNETQNAMPTVVTEGLLDSVTSQGDKFQGIWAVYDVHFRPIERKTITNTVNSAQSSSTLNAEAPEYQPQKKTVRALYDHPTSALFIPRRSARIQSRLINNRPNLQDISNTDRCEKADASIHSDTTTGDDGRIPRSTLPQTVDTDGAESAIVQEEEGELDDLAQQTGHDGGDDGDNNIETAHKEAGTAEDNQEPVDHEAKNVQDGIVTSKLLEGLLQVPNIMENDYMSDEDLFAHIYKYITYDILTHDNVKNKKLLLMADFCYVENNVIENTITTFEKN